MAEYKRTVQAAKPTVELPKDWTIEPRHFSVANEKYGQTKVEGWTAHPRTIKAVVDRIGIPAATEMLQDAWVRAAQHGSIQPLRDADTDEGLQKEADEHADRMVKYAGPKPRAKSVEIGGEKFSAKQIAALKAAGKL